MSHKQTAAARAVSISGVKNSEEPGKGSSIENAHDYLITGSKCTQHSKVSIDIATERVHNGTIRVHSHYWKL